MSAAGGEALSAITEELAAAGGKRSLSGRTQRNLAILLVTLVWLGWTAGVQLSTVNVINYAMAPFSRFDVGFYLAEPLMVIIDCR